LLYKLEYCIVYVLINSFKKVLASFFRLFSMRSSGTVYRVCILLGGMLLSGGAREDVSPVCLLSVWGGVCSEEKQVNASFKVLN